VNITTIRPSTPQTPPPPTTSPTPRRRLPCVLRCRVGHFGCGRRTTDGGFFRQQSPIAQLDAVVQGKGARSQRRLYTRSRLRAALALQLMSAATGAGALNDTGSKYRYLAS
jgi:hypothetical protein